MATQEIVKKNPEKSDRITFRGSPCVSWSKGRSRWRGVPSGKGVGGGGWGPGHAAGDSRFRSISNQGFYSELNQKQTIFSDDPDKNLRKKSLRRTERFPSLRPPLSQAELGFTELCDVDV